MSKITLSSHPLFPRLVEKLIIQFMIKYQKDNNIKGMCAINVQFLYDMLRALARRGALKYSSVKAAPVIAVSTAEEKNVSACMGGTYCYRSHTQERLRGAH